MRSWNVSLGIGGFCVGAWIFGGVLCSSRVLSAFVGFDFWGGLDLDLDLWRFGVEGGGVAFFDVRDLCWLAIVCLGGELRYKCLGSFEGDFARWVCGMRGLCSSRKFVSIWILAFLTNTMSPIGPRVRVQ